MKNEIKVKFYNKDMSLTEYSLNCGYIEMLEDEDISVKLYKDSCYHVISYDRVNNKREWKSFDNLTDSRQYFYKELNLWFRMSKFKYLKRVSLNEKRGN